MCWWLYFSVYTEKKIVLKKGTESLVSQAIYQRTEAPGEDDHSYKQDILHLNNSHWCYVAREQWSTNHAVQGRHKTQAKLHHV